jgi:hypothetical protein
MSDESEKILEISSRNLIEVLSQYVPVGTEEYHEKISVRIAGVQAGIRTEHLPTSSLDCYQCASLLG